MKEKPVSKSNRNASVKFSDKIVEHGSKEVSNPSSDSIKGGSEKVLIEKKVPSLAKKPSPKTN